MYLRRSERVFDPLAEKVVRSALATERDRAPVGAAPGDRARGVPEVPAR
jgi:hypothetical protein